MPKTPATPKKTPGPAKASPPPPSAPPKRPVQPPLPSKAGNTTSDSDSASPDLFQLLQDSIKDLYWAENHLVRALPKVKEAAGDPALRKAIGDHLELTKGHVSRLEKVFDLLDRLPRAKKCDAMEGLVMESEGLIYSTTAGTMARDRGLIMACQKVEHYEIASYRGLILLATQLGRTDIADLLNETLTEEQDSDNTLTALAQKNKTR